MTGHDLTQAMLAGVLALQVLQLRLNLAFTRDLASMRERVAALKEQLTDHTRRH